MARGTQLSALVAQLRAETGRSQKVSVGVDELDNLKAQLRRVQQQLYDDWEWPFLRVQRTITLAAGQRYYDLPSDLDFDNIEDIALQYNQVYQGIERGIDFFDYSSFDSNNDERSSPALKWDIRNTGSGEQMEVWPIPNDNIQTIYLFGTKTLGPLIQESDTADLDDHLIVLHCAAEMLKRQKSADAPEKAKLANDRLIKLRGKTQKKSKPVQIGLKKTNNVDRNKVKIIVS